MDLDIDFRTSIEDLQSLKKDRLKQLCRENSLKVGGNKNDLCLRSQKYKNLRGTEYKSMKAYRFFAAGKVKQIKNTNLSLGLYYTSYGRFPECKKDYMYQFACLNCS